MANKKIFTKQNVYEAAVDRMRWCFREFPEVIVSMSGGKDSTVVFHLALMVAREMGRLPLKVFFLDQEAEWLATIDYVRTIMTMPEVEPIWLQIPFKIFNATSFTEHWLMAWDPEKKEEWCHPQDPLAKTVNPYGTDRFHQLFGAALAYETKGKKACYVGGVRAEESPRRSVGLTMTETYKGRTWGKILDSKAEQFTFYPIYDWSYLDVWKAIHDNGWSYNIVYDKMYQRGVGVMNMRVSNLHHETAVHALFILQEVEPDNYVRVCRRLKGIDMAGKMQNENFFCPKTLPFMFSGWKEYRDYLLANLIHDPEWRVSFAKKFASMDDDMYWCFGDKLYHYQIQSILTNDWEFVKLNNITIPKHLWPEMQRRRKERKNETASAGA